MSLRRFGLVLVALALVAGPATAAEPAPHITDECGDAGSRGEWNGDSLELEENRGHLDLASGRVAGVYDAAGALAGFTATISVCGAVSATEGGYNLGWSYGDGCYGDVSWTMPGRHTPNGSGIAGQATAAAGSHAVFTEWCHRSQQLPIDSNREQIYRVTLDDEAAVFDGDTVTITVPKQGLPEQALARLAAGTPWAGIGAVSMDQGPSMWAGYVDSEGNRGHLFVRTDFALGGGTYVVGEDAP